MNNHQIKRNRLDGLASLVGLAIALVLVVLVGVLIHEAFSSLTTQLQNLSAPQ